MSDSTVLKLSEWEKLYQAVLVATDRDSLTALVGAAEAAIVRRRQELTKREGADEERKAMDVAAGEILNIKTARLGRPVINLRSNVIEPPTVFEKIQRVVSIHHWHR
jgi:hypothetical protein